MVRESVVDGSKRFWRVNVVKSARRIFTCTQPVARFCARMRCAGAIGETQHLGLHARVVGEVGEEGFLGADGFLVPLGHHRPLVDAGRAFAHALRIAAEDRPQHRIRRMRSWPSVARPAASTRSPNFRPRPGRRRTDSGSSTAFMLAVVTHREPVGLFEIRGDLRHQLVGRDAHRGGELRVGANAFLDAARDADGIALQREAAR